MHGTRALFEQLAMANRCFPKLSPADFSPAQGRRHRGIRLWRMTALQDFSSAKGRDATVVFSSAKGRCYRKQPTAGCSVFSSAKGQCYRKQPTSGCTACGGTRDGKRWRVPLGRTRLPARSRREVKSPGRGGGTSGPVSWQKKAALPQDGGRAARCHRVA